MEDRLREFYGVSSSISTQYAVDTLVKYIRNSLIMLDYMQEYGSPPRKFRYDNKMIQAIKVVFFFPFPFSETRKYLTK